MNYVSSEVVAFLLTISVGYLILFLGIRGLKRVIPMLITDPVATRRANKALMGAGFTLAIIYLIFAVSDKLDIFALLLGAIGAGLTFSLQQVILCVVGWFAITVGRYYTVGDRIILDGVSGDVIAIGLFKTTLVEMGDSRLLKASEQFYRGRVMHIPNCAVLNSTHYNFTQLSTFLWDELVVTLDHQSNINTSREVINKVVKRCTLNYQDVASDSWKKVASFYQLDISDEGCLEPQVTLEVDEQGFRYSIRYLVDYRQRRIVRDLIYTSLLSELPRTHGQVVIGQQLIRIEEVPLVRVQNMD